MASFFRKNKIPIAVAAAVLLLLALSAMTASIHRGRLSAVSAVRESASVYTEENSPAAADVFRMNSMENPLLPAAFSGETAQSVKRTDCKKYSELTVRIKQGELTARDYHYAYLVEDEPVRIPEDAVRFSENNVDFFITEKQDGTAEALYYQGLTKYTLTVRMTADDLVLLLKGME